MSVCRCQLSVVVQDDLQCFLVHESAVAMAAYG